LVVAGGVEGEFSDECARAFWARSPALGVAVLEEGLFIGWPAGPRPTPSGAPSQGVKAGDLRAAAGRGGPQTRKLWSPARSREWLPTRFVAMRRCGRRTRRSTCRSTSRPRVRRTSLAALAGHSRPWRSLRRDAKDTVSLAAARGRRAPVRPTDRARTRSGSDPANAPASATSLHRIGPPGSPAR
jgi:hypothetical protein